MLATLGENIGFVEHRQQDFPGVESIVSASLQPILALLGYPVAGNPLQYMIEKALAQRELDWRYLSLEVAPENLADAVRGMKAMGFSGGNCTHPHESAVGPLFDRVGPIAELSGVVNCFHTENGDLIGENTVGSAVAESIRLRIDPEGKQVVLFGSGGWARAVAIELAMAKVAGLTLVDTEEESARELIRLLAERLQYEAAFASWEEHFALAAETEVVINGTTTGAGETAPEFPLELASLTPEILVVDRLLSPPETWLLREAEARGCATIDGLEIFIAQVAIDFRLWTGVAPDTSVLREAVEEYLEL
ncbi:MAG: shikimate dehydrogenase [Rhodopirellula sp.]|nr:shikimate dehydrogenase [Rhodopirellula sp.]